MTEHAMLFLPEAAALPAGAASVATRLGTGVQMFFVLSGYLIAGALERARTTPHGLQAYFIHRAAKILPLYLLFLHLHLLLYWLLTRQVAMPVMPPNSITPQTFTLPNYLLHLFFLQGLSPTRLNSLLDGSWSVVCEVYFYALFPLVNPFLRSPTRAACAAAASLAAAAAFAIAAKSSPHGFVYYAFPSQLPCFLFGVYAWQLRERHPGLRLDPVHSLALAACVGLLGFGVSRAQTAPLGIYLPLAALVTVLLVAARFEQSGPLAAAIRRVGRQSYALFFLHVLIMKCIYTWRAGSTADTTTTAWLTLNVFLGIGGAWLLSQLVFDRVDRWWVDFARSRLGSWSGYHSSDASAPDREIRKGATKTK